MTRGGLGGGRVAHRGRRETEVELLPDTGHCAISKLPEVLPTMIEWAKRQLAD
jgi:esterase FrsA